MHDYTNTPKLSWSSSPSQDETPAPPADAPLLLPPPDSAATDRQLYAELVAFLADAEEEGTRVSMLTVDEFMAEHAPGSDPKEE